MNYTITKIIMLLPMISVVFVLRVDASQTNQGIIHAIKSLLMETSSTICAKNLVPWIKLRDELGNENYGLEHIDEAILDGYFMTYLISNSLFGQSMWSLSWAITASYLEEPIHPDIFEYAASKAQVNKMGRTMNYRHRKLGVDVQHEGAKFRDRKSAPGKSTQMKTDRRLKEVYQSAKNISSKNSRKLIKIFLFRKDNPGRIYEPGFLSEISFIDLVEILYKESNREVLTKLRLFGEQITIALKSKDMRELVERYYQSVASNPRRNDERTTHFTNDFTLILKAHLKTQYFMSSTDLNYAISTLK